MSKLLTAQPALIAAAAAPPVPRSGRQPGQLAGQGQEAHSDPRIHMVTTPDQAAEMCAQLLEPDIWGFVWAVNLQVPQPPLNAA